MGEDKGQRTMFENVTRRRVPAGCWRAYLCACTTY